jgi:hypothetical protein
VIMLGFLDLQGVINPGQYGFMSGNSSAMVIQDMVESAWDSKRAALGGIYRPQEGDQHGILLSKLGSYLEGRFQYVVQLVGWLGLWSLRVQFWGPCFFSSMSMTW